MLIVVKEGERLEVCLFCLLKGCFICSYFCCFPAMLNLTRALFKRNMLQSLQKGQTEILNKLASIDSPIAKHEGMIADIKDSLGATKKQVEDLGEVVTEQRDDISILQKEFKNLQAKNVDLENRCRRQNLSFYGIDDNKAKTWDQFEELIKKILGDKLGIEVASLQRAHRIGVYREQKKATDYRKFPLVQKKERHLVERENIEGVRAQH
ncbi:hypothetical protein HPB48_001971 [Haemaphysalis longicornis]|uniref:Uncharacterized protein n=1 Tax=Haemaphysalis longicornis TaxID=44386 RepID=A0A9J6GGV1_HAELO|nr:hypothetical protein HPB48_001971 [Haemaphysalis longicornis]